MWDAIAADPEKDYTAERRGAVLGAVASISVALYVGVQQQYALAAVLVAVAGLCVQLGRFAAALEAQRGQT